MFENILFQEAARKELTNEMQRGTLPPSILLYGPPLSGKTTLALELARVLSCQDDVQKGLWGCICWSCRQQRELAQNQTLVMGHSAFSQEIQIYRNFLRSSSHLDLRKQGILLLGWLRSINKVLKRYDPALWGEEKSRNDKLRKAQKAQEEFAELLASFHPKELRELLEKKENSGVLEKLFSDADALNKRLDRCADLAETMIAAIPQGIPIHQIRQLQQWSYQTSESCKVAILEGAETMNPSASNAMLKLLEEPPENCYFILTTRRKQSLLPTVLSRLRAIPLHERSEAEEVKIVQRIFRTAEEHTLKNLFLSDAKSDGASKNAVADNDIGANAVQRECQAFLDSLRARKPFFAIRANLTKIDLEVFLQNLSFLLQGEIQAKRQRGAAAEQEKQKEQNFSRYQKFLKLSSQAMQRHRIYHDAPVQLLQNLYFDLIQ